MANLDKWWQRPIVGEREIRMRLPALTLRRMAFLVIFAAVMTGMAWLVYDSLPAQRTHRAKVALHGETKGKLHLLELQLAESARRLEVLKAKVQAAGKELGQKTYSVTAFEAKCQDLVAEVVEVGHQLDLLVERQSQLQDHHRVKSVLFSHQQMMLIQALQERHKAAFFSIGQAQEMIVALARKRRPAGKETKVQHKRIMEASYKDFSKRKEKPHAFLSPNGRIQYSPFGGRQVIPLYEESDVPAEPKKRRVYQVPRSF